MFLHRSCGQEKQERETVARVEEKGEGKGVHERHIEEVKFLPDCGAGAVVPAEGDPGSGRGELAHEGRDPRDEEEQSRLSPPKQSAGRKKKHGEKEENVGPKDNGLEEELEGLHYDCQRLVLTSRKYMDHRKKIPQISGGILRALLNEG
jgi:hypothetical protein